MSYVIYHKETTVLHRAPARSSGCWKDNWKSKGAATRELNAAERSGKIVDKDKYAIAEAADFYANIEKKVERTNLMSGKKYMESVNTPSYCSPSCESYWSM